MKILIIRFSSIGDIVLTTPVLRCIKAQLPGAEVHYLLKKDFAPVLTANPHIDKLHFLEDDLNAVITELKKEKFDFIVDLHHNLRTARVKAGLKPAKPLKGKQPVRLDTASFPKLNVEKWLYVNAKINLLPDKSIVERYFEAVAPIGVKNDGLGLEYYYPEEQKLKPDDIPTSHWNGYVACVIGGSYATKRLPVEQWKAFCAEVPYPVILCGGIDDRDEGQLIAADDPIKIYNSCGKFKFNESAQLIEKARVVVSNDTGLMHIAAAYGKPVISLWGNTAPDFGMFPYYGGNNLKTRVNPKSTLLENRKLRCHPCSKLGYGKCPRGHFKCMRQLDMSAAVIAVKKYWT